MASSSREDKAIEDQELLSFMLLRDYHEYARCCFLGYDSRRVLKMMVATCLSMDGKEVQWIRWLHRARVDGEHGVGHVRVFS